MAVIPRFDYPKPTRPTAHNDPNVMTPNDNHTDRRTASVMAITCPISRKVISRIFNPHEMTEITAAPGNAVAIAWTRGRKAGGRLVSMICRPSWRVGSTRSVMMIIVPVMGVGLRGEKPNPESYGEALHATAFTDCIFGSG